MTGAFQDFPEAQPDIGFIVDDQDLQRLRPLCASSKQVHGSQPSYRIVGVVALATTRSAGEMSGKVSVI
jgi:hypothetical protein